MPEYKKRDFTRTAGEILDPLFQNGAEVDIPTMALVLGYNHNTLRTYMCDYRRQGLVVHGSNPNSFRLADGVVSLKSYDSKGRLAGKKPRKAKRVKSKIVATPKILNADINTIMSSLEVIRDSMPQRNSARLALSYVMQDIEALFPRT
jgi:hypothetical protein